VWTLHDGPSLAGCSPPQLPVERLAPAELRRASRHLPLLPMDAPPWIGQCSVFSDPPPLRSGAGAGSGAARCGAVLC